MMKPRLLVLTPEPIEGASSRLRAIDFIPRWQNTFEIRHLAFLSSRSFRLKDQPGRVTAKCMSVLLDLVWFLLRFPIALWWANGIFVHRNIAPLGPPILEWLAAICTDWLVYDFDDAIYLNPDTARNRLVAPLKMNSFRTRQLIQMADLVVAGNEHLASYARQYQTNVRIIPTGLDLEQYRSAKAAHLAKGVGFETVMNRCETVMNRSETVVIGWVGGPGTSGFVKDLMPVLERALTEFPNAELHLIGADFESDRNRVHIIDWHLGSELTDMAAFSIGINPLQDNAFTRGKCGFKVIQYQALGIPVISSPVGVCAEQVRPGLDGFLTTDHASWEEALTKLLENAELRQSMSEASAVRAETYDQQRLADSVAELMLECSTLTAEL